MGKRFDPDTLSKILALVSTPEEKQLILEADDPVLWAERHLFDPDTGLEKFKCKELFASVLKDGRKDRAVRAGRQIGKSVSMTVDLMHTAIMNSNTTILVFTTEKKMMNRILEIMNNLLNGSDINGSFRMGKKPKKTKGAIEPEYDYEINVSNDSAIRFFFMSQKPDKARGQTGNYIYLDETAYLPEKAFPVITGILKASPKIKMWASSTPVGIEGDWFQEYCTRCADPESIDSVEYHLPSTLEKNWPEVEARLREVIFDDATWVLEVLAEWAEAKGAVYKKENINNALERSIIHNIYVTYSDIYEMAEYQNADKFLGVDWNNPQNGVRILEISEMFGGIWITRNEKIALENYTQLTAVKRIMDLHSANNYKMLSVDAGFGDTQVEMILKSLIASGQDPAKVLNIVDSASKEEIEIIYTSPETGARKKEKIKVRVKTKIIGLLSNYLEGIFVILKEEQGKQGIVREISNFRRKSTARDGGFIYTENVHSLTALQYCIHGHDKYLKLGNKTKQSSSIILTETLSKILTNGDPEKIGKTAPKMALALRSNKRTMGLYGTRRSIL